MKTIIIDELFSAVCNNKLFYVKTYYQNGGKPNLRFSRFGKQHSLIMGAVRNGNDIMVELLKSNNETILPEETEEYKEYINKKEKTIMKNKE